MKGECRRILVDGGVEVGVGRGEGDMRKTSWWRGIGGVWGRGVRGLCTHTPVGTGTGSSEGGGRGSYTTDACSEGCGVERGGCRVLQQTSPVVVE